jgi:hypothetical protein
MDAGRHSQGASSNLTELTAHIVAAFISHNSVRAEDLPALINTIQGALGRIGHGNSAHASEQDRDILRRRQAWFDEQVDLDPCPSGRFSSRNTRNPVQGREPQAQSAAPRD